MGFRPSNTYWMLDTCADEPSWKIRRWLREAGFTFKRGLKHPRADQLFARYQRGLISYDRYDHLELKTMARSRGLSFPEEFRAGGMIPLLERADDDLNFRLLDLPAELRNAVYTYYFASLPVLPEKVQQPPICLASRQLRIEALPVFYSRCTFNIRFEEVDIDTGGFYIAVTISAATARLLDSAGEHVYRMRCFRISKSIPGSWLVDLRDEAAPVKANDKNLSAVHKSHYFAKQTAELKKVVAKVIERPKEKRLRRDDIDAFAAAIQHAYLRPQAGEGHFAHPKESPDGLMGFS